MMPVFHKRNFGLGLPGYPWEYKYLQLAEVPTIIPYTKLKVEKMQCFKGDTNVPLEQCWFEKKPGRPFT